MAVNKEKRDGKIELVRFLAAVAIATYHFEWVYIGHSVFLSHFYIWVEFFFLVSGFFLYFSGLGENKQYESGDRSASFQYVFSQIRKVYPLYLAGFVFTFVVTNVATQLPVRQWAEALWEAKWEVLLGVMYGFGSSVYNKGGAPEQISALLFCSLIIHYLITRHRSAFVHIVAPLAVVIGFGRIINTYGNISQWMAFDGYINAGLLRGFADMCTGALCAAELLPLLRKMKEKCLIAAGVVLPCVFVVFLVIGRKYIDSCDLVLYIFLFGLLLTSLYTWQYRVPKRMDGILRYLGKLSYPLFLFHYGILILLKTYAPNIGYRYGVTLFMLMTLLVAAVALFLQKEIKQRLNSWFVHKLKCCKEEFEVFL